jgi:ferritin
MTPKVLAAINQQIAAEFTASFSYLAMAAWCEHHKFTGAGRWLRMQSAEEHVHAMKLFDFVLARDHEVTLQAIPEPSGEGLCGDGRNAVVHHRTGRGREDRP